MAVTADDEHRRQVAVTQYAASTAKLDARAALHARFSTAAQPWHEWLFDEIGLRPGETVVEVGAGTGLLWSANARRVPAGLNLHLVDLSMAMCRRLHADLQVPVSVSQADAERLPFRACSADVVIANHMLYHVANQRAALEEAARVLRPRGRAIFATNGRDHMKELNDLLAAIGLPGPAADPTHHAFALEDGREIIRDVFPESEVAAFDDGLRVTDPDAMVAYIESFAELNDDQRRRLLREIAARMDDGYLSVTKAAGFVRAVRS